MPLTRRSFLQVAAIAATPLAARADDLATALDGTTLPDDAWTRAAHARLAGRPRLLAADERATISAIADAVIPRSETPGALDIGAPDFIELLIAEWLPSAEVDTLRRGIAALDQRAREVHGASWPGLSTAIATQEIAWAEASTPEPDEAQRALRRIKGWSVHAWLTSETVQKQVIRTNITPGKYEGCVPRPAARGTR